MAKACQRDAANVEEDEQQQAVRSQAVRRFDPRDAEIGVGGHQPAGQRGRTHRRDQRDHHRAAGRIMADVAGFATAQYCPEIVQHCCRITHELRKARIGRAQDTP